MTTQRTTGQEPMNRVYLAEIAGGDTEFEQELTESFLMASPRVLTRLQNSIDAADPVGVREAAHTLKGSSRAIGADPLAAVCETLEHNAREGDLADADALLRKIHDRYTSLSNFIRENWHVSA